MKFWRDLEALQKEKVAVENNLTLACETGETLLAQRPPSGVYALFLREQFLRWKLLRISCNLPFDFDNDKDFVECYMQNPKEQQNLLCELFQHGHIMGHVNTSILNLYVGEFQI